MTAYPVTVRIAGVALDPCRVALPLVITHGRSGVGTQPDAPSCSFTYLGSSPPGALGDPLEVDSETRFEPAVYDSMTATYDDPSAVYDSNAEGTVTRARFRGSIAGLKAVEVGGQVTSWAVEGVGHLARLGYRPVWLSRPQETDVARVLAIATAAGVPVEVRGAPGPQLAADEVAQDALGALHQVAASAAGLVWQAPDGTIVYGTSSHRTGVALGVLECEVIGDGITWDEKVEQVINHVTVTWGEQEGERLQSTFSDPESMAMPWGQRHVDIQTISARETDAEQLALLVLHRNAWPFWSTPSALLHGERMAPVDSRLLAQLDVSAGVLVPIPGAPGPTPGDLRPAIVEGWVETWDEAYTVQVALSDTARWVTTRLRTYAELKQETYQFWKSGSYLDALVITGVPTIMEGAVR